MSNSKKTLEIKQLKKSYGEFQALAGLNFSAQSGEIIGLLGPNGSGKSTSLKILSGVLRPDRGEVVYEGVPQRKNLAAYQAKLGFVPELTAVYPELQVKEYLLLMAKLRGLTKLAALSKVEEVLAIFSLESVANYLIQQLSKGYTQRVMLAQALLHQPEILILDEPNTGLDPLQINELHQILLSLKNQMIIILSSHQLIEIKNLSDRVIGLSKGQQVFDQQLQGNEDLASLYESLSVSDHLGGSARV